MEAHPPKKISKRLPYGTASWLVLVIFSAAIFATFLVLTSIPRLPIDAVTRVNVVINGKNIESNVTAIGDIPTFLGARLELSSSSALCSVYTTGAFAPGWPETRTAQVSLSLSGSPEIDQRGLFTTRETLVGSALAHEIDIPILRELLLAQHYNETSQVLLKASCRISIGLRIAGFLIPISKSFTVGPTTMADLMTTTSKHVHLNGSTNQTNNTDVSGKKSFGVKFHPLSGYASVNFDVSKKLPQSLDYFGIHVPKVMFNSQMSLPTSMPGAPEPKVATAVAEGLEAAALAAAAAAGKKNAAKKTLAKLLGPSVVSIEAGMQPIDVDLTKPVSMRLALEVACKQGQHQNKACKPTAAVPLLSSVRHFLHQTSLIVITPMFSIS